MTTITTVVAAIAKAHFMATAAQVETLAHDVVAGMNADGTYLRVLVAHMQSKLGKPRRGKQPPQEPVLDSIHEALYPSVLKGVSNGEEITDAERNRRANFARSAASTVRAFIRGCGNGSRAGHHGIVTRAARLCFCGTRAAPYGATSCPW